MDTKEAILERLQQNVNPDGTSQFNYSRDMSTKHLEQELLKELESEGYIQQLTISLGSVLYRLLYSELLTSDPIPPTTRDRFSDEVIQRKKNWTS